MDQRFLARSAERREQERWRLAERSLQRSIAVPVAVIVVVTAALMKLFLRRRYDPA
jgi:hypothetical protein